MTDDRDFFQRQAEAPVRLARPFRLLLAVVVFVGGILFLALGGLLFFATDRSRLPSPTGALLLLLLILALGCAFAYVGVRLALIKRHADHLMAPRGARIASYCTAALGGLMLLSAVFSSNLEFATGGVMALLVAYWLHASAKRIGNGRKNEF